MVVCLNEKHSSIHLHSAILSFYLSHEYSSKYYMNFSVKLLILMKCLVPQSIIYSQIVDHGFC